MVESTPKSETRFVDLPAEAGAATHTSDEISLAATAGRLTSAEVSPAPTAEELAEVPAESQTCEEVAVEPTPLLVTQSVDVTAAAEAAEHASDEFALTFTAGHFGAAEVASAPTAEDSRRLRRTPSLVRKSWLKLPRVRDPICCFDNRCMGSPRPWSKWLAEAGAVARRGQGRGTPSRS